MAKKVAVLPGDGIGPEIVSSAVAVINALVSDIELINGDFGYDCYKRAGEALPRITMDLIDECDAILVGCVNNPDSDKLFRNPLADIKKRLDLYAEVRKVLKIVPDIGMLGDIDATFIMENDEGMFNISEIDELDGATLTKRVSYSGSKRICQFTKKYMEDRHDKHVTCVHKADMYKLTDGLFLNTFREVMGDSDIEYDDMKADEMASYIMSNPRNVNYVVSVSPYGDILSEEAAALTGGTHLVPTAIYGKRKALFKPLHGPNETLQGLNIVNPTAALLSAGMMLEYLGYTEEADILKESIRSAYKRGHRTPDVGGNTGTYDFTTQVVKICETGQ